MDKRKELKRLRNKLDKIFSLFVRQKWKEKTQNKCPLCQYWGFNDIRPIQCCFHFISRRHIGLRWDFFNVVGACHRCNYMEQKWPDISRAWYIQRYGHLAYLDLVKKSRQKVVITKEGYLQLIRKYELLKA